MVVTFGGFSKLKMAFQSLKEEGIYINHAVSFSLFTSLIYFAVKSLVTNIWLIVSVCHVQENIQEILTSPSHPSWLCS